MVVIPFAFLPPKILARLANPFMGVGSRLNKLFPYMQLELDRSNFKIQAKKYITQSFIASIFLFILLSVILTLLFIKIKIIAYFGVIAAFAFIVIIFFMQMNYPKILSKRRIRKLDSDLLSSLRGIIIQLNSGVPLFEAMVIVSEQDYGEVSTEFKKAVKKINAGVPQIEALEEMAVQNPSLYFRRTIWQIINGMKEGATIKTVMSNVIENLSKEQIIQIEKYGSELSPLAMFYMMGAIILPALGLTFFIVIASFLGLTESMTKLMLGGLLGFVLFFQIIFAGIIKTKRPNLLGD